MNLFIDKDFFLNDPTWITFYFDYSNEKSFNEKITGIKLDIIHNYMTF